MLFLARWNTHMHTVPQKMQGSFEEDVQTTCLHLLATVIQWQKG